MIRRPGGSSSMTNIRTLTGTTQQFTEPVATARSPPSNHRYALSPLYRQYSNSPSCLRNVAMCTQKKMDIFKVSSISTNPAIFPASSSRYSYSNTRNLNDRDKNNKHPTSNDSSSTNTPVSTTIVEGITSFSNQLFNTSTNIVKKSATEASNITSSVAKKTLDGTQQLASSAISESQKIAERAAQQVSSAASELARKSLDETQKMTKTAYSESQKLAQQAAKDTAKLASDSFQQVSSRTKQKVSQTVEQNVHKPIQQTSQHIKKSSEELVESITSSGTKLLKWFAWWSLAAVAVYGIVTTLPIALIKYAMERKNDPKNCPTESTTINETTTDIDKSRSGNNNRGVWSSIRIISSSPSNDK